MNTVEEQIIELQDKAIALARAQKVLLELLLENQNKRKLQDYLANGGDSRDLPEQKSSSGLPEDGSLPF